MGSFYLYIKQPEMSEHALDQRKYDRQLRLWASNGQRALESSHLCLLGASTVGIETLKNLILPGISEITLIDELQISQSKLSSNFFIDEAFNDDGNMAEALFSSLSGLNPSVKLKLIQKDPTFIVQNMPSEFWNQFNLVLIGRLDTTILSILSDILYDQNIPLMIVDSVGFYGLARISVKEHTIIESHPDSLVDLRLDCPWPELIDFSTQYDLNNLSPEDHEHVPYVVLLLKYLDQWKSTHDGDLPKNFQERNIFKKILIESAPSVDSENYEEARSAVWRLSQPTDIPQNVQDIMMNIRAQMIDKNTPIFWILVSALRKFIEANSDHVLPLSGVLPDMKSTTKSYVQLQHIYRAKALSDFTKFKAFYTQILTSLDKTPIEKYIPDEVGETFCKNSRHINVINGTRVSNELVNYDYLSDVDFFSVYIAFQACRRYQADTNEHLSPDKYTIIEKYASQLLPKNFENENLPEALQNVLQEILRSSGVELVNISSFIGGIAAQEIIKLISHQYIPMQNSVVYDGIHCTTCTHIV